MKGHRNCSGHRGVVGEVRMSSSIEVLFYIVFLSGSTDEDKCAAAMRDAKITDKFAKLVAHRIHSLTTEDLVSMHCDPTQSHSILTVLGDNLV